MEVKTNLYNALYYHNASVFFYRGVMIILLLLILGCSDSNKVAKETNVSIDVINKVGFKSNSSLKFEIMAKQLYVASQRVL